MLFLEIYFWVSSLFAPALRVTQSIAFRLLKMQHQQTQARWSLQEELGKGEESEKRSVERASIVCRRYFQVVRD